MPPETPKGPKPVGIWIPISADLQTDTKRPEHYEQLACKYAQARGWTMEKVYRLETVSGKSVKQRRQTEKRLENVAESWISGLIFSKLARLARHTRELLSFADHPESVPSRTASAPRPKQRGNISRGRSQRFVKKQGNNCS